jgi:MoaA/NifB/PqqE/SkfB family radical SAM enzyme
MPPTGRHRILQIHPTRLCNLLCRHCYSESGPAERGAIDAQVLSAAIADAARLGYSTVAVSGGEPFLYAGLPAVLGTARAHGMTATITTNGTVLTERRVAQVAGLVNLVAVSLDGIPASHNRMRGSPRAFESMVARLDTLRRAQIPFGFIFTLTLHNVHELAWVAEFARAEGARLLQIHPLEETGRAASTLVGSSPDAVEGGYAFLEATRLEEGGGDQLRIQLDLTNGIMVDHDPAAVMGLDSTDDGDAPFADLVSPLVIEADGTAVPLTYGFPRAFALGDIHADPLHVLAARWREEHYPSFRRVCRAVYQRLVSRKRAAMVNWYEMVAKAAARQAGPGRRARGSRRIRRGAGRPPSTRPARARS